ncbi:uncharacterized protein LOC119667179 [Teleopsis dalmanni]|uniref:uncharacterized protein LOC119667179 n=1 Tax=Teleopsis dalmanni TaxID=139649 RepID=UPI0018CEEC5C|nr:uncharacterized protein LOC119667179 [Teleopsis dalmanni]
MSATVTSLATDSITLKIINKDALLKGVGNELYLHTNTSIDKLSTRLKGKIHGIEIGHGDKALVYGEKEFVLLQFLNNEFKELERAHLTDWISAGHFLEDKSQFVLLTAHSILLLFNINNGDSVHNVDNFTLKRSFSCTDKSTLYCAHIHGATLEKLVIFGGNAFGELLIWQLKHYTDTKNDKVEVKLLQRISAHNGVIFSINYNKLYSLLTTTSDDRSIRFWQVNCLDDDWCDAILTPVASGYGHVARVFQAKFIEYGQRIYAISVGEDSYFCVWQSNGQLLFKRRQNFGATIWNLECCGVTNTLYTVDSTGNLLSYDLQTIFEDNETKLIILPKVNKEQSNEYVAKIKFLQQHLLVGVTNNNRLVYKPHNDEAIWSAVEGFEPFKCTVLEVEQNLIALCGYKRVALFVYDGIKQKFNKLHDLEMLSGVVRAFQFLSENLYIISDELGNCKLLKSENDELLEWNIELPKCKERWLTAALLIENNYLVISNRQGNFMLYKAKENSFEFEHKFTLKHPHGNLGATLFKLVSATSELILVKSAGHDGTLITLCISKQNVTMKINSRLVVPVAWVEDLICCEQYELLLGFNDNHFVMWCKEQDFLLQVPCGGGHRCWHYNIVQDEVYKNWMIHLVFIKNKQVRLHKLKIFNEVQSRIKLTVANFWHVKPCNILQIVKKGIKENVFISAGDDNLIKISVYNFSLDLVKLVGEVHTHISNIRTLQTVKIDENDYLIFSGGGRAQICVTKLNLLSYEIEELINYTLKSTPSTQATYTFDPETRIMSIAVLQSVSTKGFAFELFIGCSDGFLRKLLIDSNFEVKILAEIYYSKCLLQVSLVADLYVVAAATDGVLRFYNLNLNQVVYELRHHASGVNALDICLSENKTELHVLTGGDDEAVSYTKLNLVKFEVIKSLKLNQHTAQVTATCLSPDGLNGYTSSVDQNVFKICLKTGKVEQLIHACIADVKGLCLGSNDLFVLYGCGLQTFYVNKKNTKC